MVLSSLEQDTHIPRSSIPPVVAPLDRVSGALLDFFVLTPIITLLLAPLERALTLTQLNADEWSSEILVIVKAALLLFVLWSYFTLCWWKFSATPGERFWGLRVRDVHSLRPLTFWQSSLRAFWFVICVCLCGLPMAALWHHPLRRTIYDRVSDSVVLAASFQTHFPPTPLEQMKAQAATAFCSLFLLTFVASNIYVHPQEPEDADSCQFQDQLQQLGGEAKQFSKIEVTLGLYQADFLSRRCLRLMGEREYLRSENPWALVALSLTSDEPMASLYKKKLCERKDAEVACDALELAREQDTLSWQQTSYQLKKSLGTAPLFVRVMAIQHFTKLENVIMLEKLLVGLPTISAFSNLYTDAKFVIDRVNNHFEQAKLFYAHQAWNLSGEDKLQRISWFCRWQQETPKWGKNFCHDLQASFSAVTPQSDEASITLLRWLKKNKDSKLPPAIAHIEKVIESDDWHHPLLKSDWIAAEKISRELKRKPSAEVIRLAYSRWIKMEPFSESFKAVGPMLQDMASKKRNIALLKQVREHLFDSGGMGNQPTSRLPASAGLEP